MAPIKFEENIKDKLEKRTINPSDKSWEKLLFKLDEQEGKSKNKVIWWIAFAASLVGVFLATTIFFDKGENNLVSPTVVESPINDIKKQKQALPPKEVVVENEESSLNEINKLQKKSKIKIVRQKAVSNVVKKNKVLGNDYNESNSVESNVLKISESISEAVNHQEIVSQNPELNKDLVTDLEIESLLKNAQKDITLQRINKENIITVDANSLLQDVESDLDLSFRDKMFNTIISSYNTVKTAVVERND